MVLVPAKSDTLVPGDGGYIVVGGTRKGWSYIKKPPIKQKINSLFYRLI